MTIELYRGGEGGNGSAVKDALLSVDAADLYVGNRFDRARGSVSVIRPGEHKSSADP